MPKDIRILLVDDHQVVREGLRHMLGQEEDMEIIGQGATSYEALSRLEELAPNIVLMDIKMPGMDGIELTRRVKQKNPSCKVIMLTLYDEYSSQAMEAGAAGYLTKDTKREELVQAIRRVHGGEIVIGNHITKPAIYKNVEAGGTLFSEVQLIILPPVESNQLMRFASQAGEALQSRVLQVVGSWHEGTAMTIILNKAMLLEDILKKLRESQEAQAVEEEPPPGTSPSLLKKATAITRLKNGPRKTIFVTLSSSGGK